jgi:hypothetical protein
MPAIGWRDQRRARNLSGDCYRSGSGRLQYRDRMGPGIRTGCGSSSPIRPASPRPVSRVLSSPAPASAGRRPALDDRLGRRCDHRLSGRKSGRTRPSQRLRLSLTEHFLSYLYNAMPGFASNSYPLSPFYERSWFSKLGNGHFDFPRAGAVSPAVLFPKDREAILLRRRQWCGGSAGSAFGAVPTQIKAIRLGADLMHIIWFCAVPRRRAR